MELEKSTPLSLKVAIVYLLALILVSISSYLEFPLTYYLILSGVNALIIYGFIYRKVWAWILLLLSSLVCLLNPFTATKTSSIPAGSLVAAFQLFQSNNMIVGWFLVYASIFTLTLAIYAWYGWKFLSQASQKTDNIWAGIMMLIFLVNLTGVLKIAFGQPPSMNMLIYGLVFVGSIALWHYLDTKGKKQGKEKNEESKIKTVNNKSQALKKEPNSKLTQKAKQKKKKRKSGKKVKE